MEVESGPDGFARFVSSVRVLFDISAGTSLDLNFDCVEPTSGESTRPTARPDRGRGTSRFPPRAASGHIFPPAAPDD